MTALAAGLGALRDRRSAIFLGLLLATAILVPLGNLALPADHPSLSELTERELEVLARLLSGARVPAISEQLSISPHTVRNHLKAIYRKVGASDQSDLIERMRALSSEGSG